MILCITHSDASSTNASHMYVLGMLVITDLFFRPLYFLVIMLNMKQLRISHPSAENVLPWPRPHKGSLEVPWFDLLETLISVTRLCFECV